MPEQNKPTVKPEEKPLAYVGVTLEGYKRKFTSANDLIAATVTLGQNDNSSNCSVQINDPCSTIAADLIKHTLSNGGIQKIPQGNAGSSGGDGSGVAMVDVETPSTPLQWQVAIVRECLRQGVTDRGQIAYILATAQRETSMGKFLEEIASGAAYEGRSDLGNTQPGDGKRYKGRGLVQVTGRGNYAKWSARLKVDFVGSPEQIKLPKYCLPIMVIGMKEGSFTGAKLGTYINGSKQDFYNARRVVNGTDHAQEIADNAKDFLTKLDHLIKSAGGATISVSPKDKPASTATTKPGDKPDTKPSREPAETSAQPQATSPSTADETFKGAKLYVDIGGFTFTFYHQGTETKGDITILSGQGIRWVLNRRLRNKTDKQVKLSELALKICKAHGIKLDFQSQVDPVYSFVDQTGISDYALLKRECDRAGLFISEEPKKGGTITIKSLKDIRDTALDIQPGYNLISYQIKDVAVDASTEEASDLKQQDAKYQLNPITGQFEPINKDVDTVKDNSTTGKPKQDTKGKLEAGQDATVSQSQARTKRVKGLPSNFTILLDEKTLALQPLDAVRTKGLPGVLSRVWMVDSITHDVVAGTTTVSCYSPIAVIDNTSSTPTGSTSTVNNSSNSNGFIFPCSGTITSIFGMRKHPVTGASRPHNGVDIGVPTGTPVKAAQSGTVITVAYQAGGAGKWIKIRHDNGWYTMYFHLDQQLVAQGVRVKQGDIIAKSGNTGIGTGAHLHFEIHNPQDQAVPPEKAGMTAVKKGDTV